MSAHEFADWQPDAVQSSIAGGQGSVVKVRHLRTGQYGALKSMHSDHLKSKERRFRMSQEVNLLKLVNANGMPRVLAHTTDNWESIGEAMQLIVEWVPGPSLAQYCSGRPQNLDTAIAIASGLLEVLGHCHAAGVLHRDIKPDNIILRNGEIAEPVLIDFGMGWAEQNEDRFGEFVTGDHQELGNRFLRLPEYAPGQHVRSTGSDVTMIVGVFFYLLTGTAPRVLLDPVGRMPHESMIERFPRDTLADARWERVRRLFKVGFQHSLDMRYLETQPLIDALASLSTSSSSVTNDPVAEQLLRINSIIESSGGSLLQQCQDTALDALQAFFVAFTSKVNAIGFEAGGQGPVAVKWGRAVRTELYLSKSRAAVPTVEFVHQISFENGRFETSYSVIGEAIWHMHYHGAFADSDSLREAAIASVDSIVATLLDRYAIELNKQVARILSTGVAGNL
jgi:serine/threonine protein kinase